MSSVVRHALGLLLLVSGVVKLVWPDAQGGDVSPVAYQAVSVVEVLLGLGLLALRTASIAVRGALLLFLSLVGFNVGWTLEKGVGALRGGCGCLGSSVEPSRGTMLIVSSCCLIAAAWLSGTLADRRAARASSAGWVLRPVMFGLALLLGWAGLPAWMSTSATTHGNSSGDELAADQEKSSAPEEVALLEGQPELTLRAHTEHTPVVPTPSTPTRVLQVLVVDDDSGEAVEGVQVWVPGFGLGKRTSRAGRATLALPDTHATEVLGRTEDGLWLRTPVSAEATTASLRVPSEVRLSGRVSWLDGQPAAGLKLRVNGMGAELAERSELENPTWRERSVSLVVTTRPDGRFEIRGLGERTVSISSAKAGTTLLARRGARGQVWTNLPALDIDITAVTGSPAQVQFVDEGSGDPVGQSFSAKFEWGVEVQGYAATVQKSGPESRLSFVWPQLRSSPLSVLRGRVTCPGYETRSFKLSATDHPDKRHTVTLRALAEVCRLRIKNPWSGIESVWDPQLTITCDGAPVQSVRPGGVLSAVRAHDAWVVANLPQGKCVVRSGGHEFAVAQLQSGTTREVMANVANFSYLILRIQRNGRPIQGRVKVSLRGFGSYRVKEVVVDPEGRLHLYPVPRGKLSVTIARDNEVSHPSKLAINVPGGGTKHEIDVPLRLRQ